MLPWVRDADDSQAVAGSSARWQLLDGVEAEKGRLGHVLPPYEGATLLLQLNEVARVDQPDRASAKLLVHTELRLDGGAVILEPRLASLVVELFLTHGRKALLVVRAVGFGISYFGGGAAHGDG